MTKPQSKQKKTKVVGQTSLDPVEFAAAVESAVRKTLQGGTLVINSGADVNLNLSFEVKMGNTSTSSQDSQISTGNIDDSTLGAVGVGRDSTASGQSHALSENTRTLLTTASVAISRCVKINDRDRADALTYLREVEKEIDEDSADWKRVDRLLTQVQSIDAATGLDLKNSLAVGRNL